MLITHLTQEIVSRRGTSRPRAALALELVAAHTEEAARARQESALNAAKFRRASRDAGQASEGNLLQSIEASGKKTTAGRPPTSSGNRCVAPRKKDHDRGDRSPCIVVVGCRRDG